MNTVEIEQAIADLAEQPSDPVIDEAVECIKDGSITGYIYDPGAAKLVKASLTR
jgi:hypothetical protein